MSIIIFLILPFSVLNLYWVGFRANYAELAYFFTSNETEYIIIYSSYSSILEESIDSYIMRVDSKTNKLISDSKLLDTMKSYYILTIPFMHLEKNDKIPFTLLEEKSKENIFKGNMLNILILLDIIQQTNKSNKNDILFNFFEKENNSNNYEIGKIYNKSNIGNEYGFCFIGYNYDDFKFNVQSIKKCLFIFSDLYFYLGEIISKTFKNITDIKIINSIPIMSLNISISLIENNFLEIKDNRNNNKLIMNCFDDDNKKKVYNYFAFMINNNIEFEKNEINLFFKNVENKIFK